MAENNLGSDVTITKILMTSEGGASVDLSHLYKYISIFEDVFSNGMSGYIKLKDSYNLPETFPIIGEETIVFEFTSATKDLDEISIFTKEFQVHRVSDFETENNSAYSTYLIHFVSVPFFTNITKRLNRSFGSETHTMKASDIVARVCDKMLNIPTKELKIEKTRFERNLVCSNWTPFQLFNFLGESDVLDIDSETDDKDSTFLFYEDRFGFKFVSWSTLIEGKLHKKQRIKKLYFGTKLNSDSTSKKIINTTQVTNYTIQELSSELANTGSGMYNNRFFYHNIITKTLRESQFNYDDAFTQSSHIESQNESYPLKTYRTINTKESTSLLPGEYQYQNDSAASSAWRQVSKSRQSQFENFIIETEVVGNSSHLLGSVLSCDIPSSRKNSDDSVAKYEQISGKYLVTKIRHIIDESGYKQILELRKGVQRKVI